MKRFIVVPAVTLLFCVTFALAQSGDTVPWTIAKTYKHNAADGGEIATVDGIPQKYLSVNVNFVSKKDAMTGSSRFRVVDARGSIVGKPTSWNVREGRITFEGNWTSLDGLYLDGLHWREPLFRMQVAQPVRPQVTTRVPQVTTTVPPRVTTVAPRPGVYVPPRVVDRGVTHIRDRDPVIVDHGVTRVYDDRDRVIVRDHRDDVRVIHHDRDRNDVRVIHHDRDRVVHGDRDRVVHVHDDHDTHVVHDDHETHVVHDDDRVVHVHDDDDPDVHVHNHYGDGHDHGDTVIHEDGHSHGGGDVHVHDHGSGSGSGPACAPGTGSGPGSASGDGSSSASGESSASSAEGCPPGESSASSAEGCPPGESSASSAEGCPPGESSASSAEGCPPGESSPSSAEGCPPGESSPSSAEGCPPGESPASSAEGCPPGESMANSAAGCPPGESMANSAAGCPPGQGGEGCAPGEGMASAAGCPPGQGGEGCAPGEGSAGCPPGQSMAGSPASGAEDCCGTCGGQGESHPHPHPQTAENRSRIPRETTPRDRSPYTPPASSRAGQEEPANEAIAGLEGNPPEETNFVLYVATGVDGGPGRVYQVNDHGRVLGWVNLPQTPSSIAMHRNNALVVSLPRDGGRIVRIDDTGKAKVILEKDRNLVHPIDLACGANSDTIAVADNLSDVISATTASGREPRVYRRFEDQKWTAQSMSVAVTKDGCVIYGTDGGKGIYRFSGNSSDQTEPYLPEAGGVAADTRSTRWAATQSPNQVYVFEGESHQQTLRLPPGKSIYRQGLLSFGPNQAVVVAGRDSDSPDAAPWLMMIDSESGETRPLFPWSKEKMMDFVVGPRMYWDSNSSSTN